jgi:hypothetical protein
LYERTRALRSKNAKDTPRKREMRKSNSAVHPAKHRVRIPKSQTKNNDTKIRVSTF